MNIGTGLPFVYQQVPNTPAQMEANKKATADGVVTQNEVQANRTGTNPAPAPNLQFSNAGPSRPLAASGPGQLIDVTA